ncbi:hypothetical protein [Leptospira kmetyi]|uniref:hypothetical protein n=1 Tax=Leptospira kmetyi TaxID=408139 RepID=UPI003EB9A6D6
MKIEAVLKHFPFKYRFNDNQIIIESLISKIKKYSPPIFHVHIESVNSSHISTFAIDVTGTLLPVKEYSEELVEIDSSLASNIYDSASSVFIKELNKRIKRFRLFIWLPIIGWVSYIFFGSQESNTFFLSIAWTLTLLVPVLAIIDRIRKNIVLYYSSSSEGQSALDSMSYGFDQMRNCNRTWHYSASGAIFDQKKSGGASKSIARSLIHLSFQNPRGVISNIKPPAIPVGSQTLYFYPDRILIQDKKATGALLYENLQIIPEVGHFLEEEGVPKDSKVIGKTWKYVNKNGSPDRRFKNNYEIPIVQYQYLGFKSESGIEEVIALSKLGAINDFVSALQRLRKTP